MASPEFLWEEWRQANNLAQETGTFEDAERARKAWAAFLKSTDEPHYTKRPGTNIIDLEARRERHS